MLGHGLETGLSDFHLMTSTTLKTFNTFSAKILKPFLMLTIFRLSCSIIRTEKAFERNV